MDWLTQIPGGKVLSDWLQHILHNLQRNDKNSILIEIAHSCTEKLLLSLPDPSLRPYVEPMFFFVLLGFQHSESVFHALVTRLPQVLRALSATAQGSVQARTTMGRLGEASQYLMIKFPNFPELYDPVIEVLNELGIHPPNENRQAGMFFIYYKTNMM